jgi:hypothetical protein
LYEWIARISAALMRDLAHVEVGLRNAYAAVIERYWAGCPVHWTRSAQAPALLLERPEWGGLVPVRRAGTSSVECVEECRLVPIRG